MYVKRHAVVKGSKRYVYLRLVRGIPGRPTAGCAIECCAPWAAKTS